MALKVGYAKCEITPKLGAYLQGHNKKRYAQMVHDPLFVRAVAFENDGLAVMLNYDLSAMNTNLANTIREQVASYIDCPVENVVITCTHTHTGPNCSNMTREWDETYVDLVAKLSMHVAGLAKNDLAPAQMFTASTACKGVTFCRRYLMKDGTARTNPGIGNPEILRPMNDPDHQVVVLKILREGAKDLVLANFGCHADSIKNVDGVDAISADWPGVTCNAVEKALDVECILFNAPCGDVAQRDHMAPKETAKQTSGWPCTVKLGQAVAGAVISLYNGFMAPVSDGPVRAKVATLMLPLKRPTEAELARSRDILEHEADYLGGNMAKTTDLFEARMLLNVAKTDGYAQALVSVLCVGGFAAAGSSGEPFCAIGKQIKEASPFEAQFALYFANGSSGYFPMKDAFSYDGYEARTCKFQPGVGELIADTSMELLNSLK